MTFTRRGGKRRSSPSGETRLARGLMRDTECTHAFVNWQPPVTSIHGTAPRGTPSLSEGSGVSFEW